jgi:hypothetical protein
MRLAMVMLLGVSLPLSASAQAGEAATASEENLQEPAPPSEPAPEEPALQLKLDDAGVDVVPSPPRTVDGYTLEEIELRIRRARIGLLSTTGVLVVGAALSLVGAGTYVVPSSRRPGRRMFTKTPWSLQVFRYWSAALSG